VLQLAVAKITFKKVNQQTGCCGTSRSYSFVPRTSLADDQAVLAGNKGDLEYMKRKLTFWHPRFTFNSNNSPT
jgi:hypothetical protein